MANLSSAGHNLSVTNAALTAEAESFFDFERAASGPKVIECERAAEVDGKAECTDDVAAMEKGDKGDKRKATAEMEQSSKKQRVDCEHTESKQCDQIDRLFRECDRLFDKKLLDRYLQNAQWCNRQNVPSLLGLTIFAVAKNLTDIKLQGVHQKLRLYAYKVRKWYLAHEPRRVEHRYKTMAWKKYADLNCQDLLHGAQISENLESMRTSIGKKLEDEAIPIDIIESLEKPAVCVRVPSIDDVVVLQSRQQRRKFEVHIVDRTFRGVSVYLRGVRLDTGDDIVFMRDNILYRINVVLKLSSPLLSHSTSKVLASGRKPSVPKGLLHVQ